jgi:GNAT superfamily N-acetyltransferase
MELKAITPNDLTTVAELFVSNFRSLRQSVPSLPATLEDMDLITHNISGLLKRHPGLAAWHDGRLVGYLTYMIVDDFRGTGRRGAYCPEWAHAVLPGWQRAVYRQMYREVGAAWAVQGCQVHAITLLAHDQEALQTWFWSGFGMGTVDAVRSMQPLEGKAHTELTIRQAVSADAEALADLDVEHCHYYTQSPVFMVLRESQTTEEFRQFLAKPMNSVWLVQEDDLPVGFLRLDGYENDGADALNGAEMVKINGAFIRAANRGQGASRAMLEAALCHHAKLGKTCCAVDFEAFNPDATNFWMRHFQPACLSLMRVPEDVLL